MAIDVIQIMDSMIAKYGEVNEKTHFCLGIKLYNEFKKTSFYSERYKGILVSYHPLCPEERAYLGQEIFSDIKF